MQRFKLVIIFFSSVLGGTFGIAVCVLETLGNSFLASLARVFPEQISFLAEDSLKFFMVSALAIAITTFKASGYRIAIFSGFLFAPHLLLSVFDHPWIGFPIPIISALFAKEFSVVLFGYILVAVFKKTKRTRLRFSLMALFEVTAFLALILFAINIPGNPLAKHGTVLLVLFAILFRLERRRSNLPIHLEEAEGKGVVGEVKGVGEIKR